MSPEVCQNKPYTYQSDIWALGCILYELCALKHAFHAENLLGLVYKIVSDKHEPIPDSYSKEMQDLINLLLIKEASQRPRIYDIIRSPFVKQHERVRVWGSESAADSSVFRRSPLTETKAWQASMQCQSDC